MMKFCEARLGLDLHNGAFCTSTSLLIVLVIEFQARFDLIKFNSMFSSDETLMGFLNLNLHKYLDSYYYKFQRNASSSKLSSRLIGAKTINISHFVHLFAMMKTHYTRISNDGAR